MNFENYNILLVDDEPEILKMNKEFLQKKGFLSIDTASDSINANFIMNEKEIHLVVLDIMMPGNDGLSLYKKWLQEGRQIPVVFLSARDEESSRLKGLGLGADDYITKPYILEELYLRIKAILRRSYHLTENKQIRLGDTQIDLLAATVHKGDKQYQLTAKEYNLLVKLYDNMGKVVSSNILLETLWPNGSYGLKNSLSVHIRRLREKIENDPSSPKYICTLRGLGYKLNGDESK